MTYKPFLQVDADSTAYFARQLETIKKKTYDEKTRPLKGLSLLPRSNEAHPGASTITYRSYKDIGIAKFIADYATGNIPKVNVIGVEVSQPIRTFAVGFDYSIQEVDQSNMTGQNIPARKAIAARKATEQLLNRTALLGDAEFGLNGFLNFPGNTEYTVPADGTGSSKLWSTKTPDQIVRDIRGMINAVEVTTNGVEIPNTVLLPQAQYKYVETTRMGSNTDTTILQFMKTNFSDIKTWMWLTELATLGTGSTTRMMCGMVDPDHVQFEVPRAFEMLAPQARGLGWEVPTHGRTAGVLEYYPLAFAIAEGI